MEQKKPTEETLEESENSQPKTQDSSQNPSSENPNSLSPGSKRPKRLLSFENLPLFGNRYFLLFVLTLLVATGVVLTTLRSSKNNSTLKKSQSLTQQQLSELKAGTTIVGDSQQILDIQGNSVFEGQVLLRNNLDVAGSVKVGGTISLPSIVVGGASNFGQVVVNGTLSIGGNTTLQGQVNIQKSLAVAGNGSFSGSLSASQISVNTLQLNGDLVVNRHIIATGSLPSKTNGTAIGGGGTASVSGSDTAGTITINTGSSPPAGNLVTVNFAQRFNTTPHVVVSPVGSSAAALDYYVTRNVAGFTLATLNPPAAGASFSFDYIVFD